MLPPLSPILPSCSLVDWPSSPVGTVNPLPPAPHSSITHLQVLDVDVHQVLETAAADAHFAPIPSRQTRHPRWKLSPSCRCFGMRVNIIIFGAFLRTECFTNIETNITT